jgi:hypothetical protein
MEQRVFIAEACIIQLQNYASQSNWTWVDIVSALGETQVICRRYLFCAFFPLKQSICPFHEH